MGRSQTDPESTLQRTGRAVAFFPGLKILSVELDDFFPQGVTEFKEFHRFPSEFLNIILVPSNPPLQVSHIGLIVLDVLIDVGFPIRIILFPIHEFLTDFPLLTLVRRRLRGRFFPIRRFDFLFQKIETV